MRPTAEQRRVIGRDLLTYCAVLARRKRSTMSATHVPAFAADIYIATGLTEMAGSFIIRKLNPSAYKMTNRFGVPTRTMAWMVDPEEFRESVCERYGVGFPDLPSVKEIDALANSLDIVEHLRYQRHLLFDPQIKKLVKNKYKKITDWAHKQLASRQTLESLPPTPSDKKYYSKLSKVTISPSSQIIPKSRRIV